MSEAPITTPSHGALGLLDPDPNGQLTRFVKSSGIEPYVFTSLDALCNTIQPGTISAVVVSFDALEPDPQRGLKRLRSAVHGARIVLLYAEEGPRSRLARRLWSAGACDFMLPLSSAPDAIRHVVLQASADAWIEQSLQSHRVDQDLSPETGLLRFLQRLSASVASQGVAEGILRELSFRLPDLIACRVLSVLVVDEASSKLHIFQTEPVDHAVIWDLAERCSLAIARFLPGPPPRPEDIELVYGPPMAASTPRREGGAEPAPFALPMVASGEAVGAIGVLPANDPEDDPKDRLVLQLIASQLATTLRHAQMMTKVRELSSKDSLTGLTDRKHLSDIVEREWSRAQRYSLQLSVVVIDLDHFKQINEIHGRFIGNAVLKAIAQLLSRYARNTDHVAYMNGDRFAMVLPETGPAGSSVLVERIRLALKTTPLRVEGAALTVAISAGIAAQPLAGAKSGDAMLAIAEAALAQAKSHGRDRTVCAGGAPSSGTSPGAEVSVEQRRQVRLALEVGATFLPVSEVDISNALRVSSINVSAHGLAVRDPAQRMKRGDHGLVYFDDRSEPMLCQVAWVAHQEGEHRAGLRSLKPADLLESSEARGPRDRNALVVTDDPTILSAVKRALRSAMYQVRIVDAQAYAVPDEILGECPLVVIGAAALRGPIGEQILRARAEGGGGLKIIVLNEDLDRAGAIEMITQEQVEHLISGASSSVDALFTTLSKLVRDEYFGVRRYLLPGVDTKTWTITDTSEKSFVLAGVRSVAEEVDCHPRVVDLLISAVDEMLINAFYHPQGRARSNSTAPVTVECGSDGRLLCVGVLDEHGLLEVNDLYQSLQSALAAERAGRLEDADSAHLGFRIMLSSLSQMAINVEPGRRCEIIGIIDMRRTLREHRAAAPSLGVFRP